MIWFLRQTDRDRDYSVLACVGAVLTLNLSRRRVSSVDVVRYDDAPQCNISGIYTLTLQEHGFIYNF